MANLIEKIKDKRAPEPETPERRDVPIVHPDPQQGLTSAQVRERTDAGWTNAPVDPPGKTVKQIVLAFPPHQTACVFLSFFTKTARK